MIRPPRFDGESRLRDQPLLELDSGLFVRFSPSPWWSDSMRRTRLARRLRRTRDLLKRQAAWSLLARARSHAGILPAANDGLFSTASRAKSCTRLASIEAVGCSMGCDETRPGRGAEALTSFSAGRYNLLPPIQRNLDRRRLARMDCRGRSVRQGK